MSKITKLFEPSDMTVGKPWKSILLFSIPMIIGNIAQQLYSTVDSIVVGHYVGDNALASVGSAAPIFNLLLVLFVGISAGVGIMVAQYFGARSRENLSKTIGTCITVTAIVSLFLMIFSPPIIPSMLRLLNTPESIIDDCSSYLIIMMLGVSGMAYYNIFSGILRGMGDSFSALLYLLVATIINIVLDILFVAKFNIGVSGVALATVIAQFVSATLSLRKLMSMRDVFDLRLRELMPSVTHVKTIIKLGIPSGLTQAIMSSAMIIVQSLTNTFGEMFIAANVIVMRVDGFAMMPNLSFGNAMTTYTGQNVGAKKYDRVQKGAMQGTLISLIFSTAITLVILLFGKSLMAVFTKTPELVNLSYYVMKILAVGYIAVAISQSLQGVMRGAGDTVTPMYVSLFTTVLLRVPLAYGISYLTRSPENPVGIFECIPLSLVISWVAGTILTFVFYKLGKWKKKAIK